MTNQSCDRREAQTRAAEAPPADVLTELNAAQLDAVRALLGAGGDPVRRVHRYDARGRRIETSGFLFGRLGRDRKTMAYDEKVRAETV